MQDEQRYVIDIIAAFLEGSCDRWAWKKFTASSLRDVELDRIRRAAAAVDLPLDSNGRATLYELLDQAELAHMEDPSRPKRWRIEAGIVTGLLAGAILWWLTYLPGDGLFRNLHLLLIPPALGAFIVALRNSRKKIGAYDPRIVEQNRKGRV